MATYLDIKNIPPRAGAVVDTDYILIKDNTGLVLWIPVTLLKTYMGVSSSNIDTIVAQGNPAIPYNIPAGYMLEYVVILASADFNLTIGTTAGGSQIYSSFPIPNNNPQPILIAYYTQVEKSIFINNVPSGSTIKLYKK